VLEEAVPPPQYGAANIRHLLVASALTRYMEGQVHPYVPGRMWSVARVLASGTPVAQPPPAAPPRMLLRFTVAGWDHDVQVWENAFTYGGQTYHLELAELKIMRSEP